MVEVGMRSKWENKYKPSIAEPQKRIGGNSSKKLSTRKRIINWSGILIGISILLFFGIYIWVLNSYRHCIIGRRKFIGGISPKRQFDQNRMVRWSAIAIGGFVLALASMLLAVNAWPALGATGADLLRDVVGDKPVARMEMTFIQIQDTLEQWKCRLGLSAPAIVWEDISSPVPTLAVEKTITPFRMINIQPTPARTPVHTSPAVETLAPSLWQPVNIPPLGSAEGEGIWSPYIDDASGTTVAYRTFVQPDPERPYTYVAIVAIDLERTRLHFVLGTIEPVSSEGPVRSGEIPTSDRTPGNLLAAFNGGFKARHGEFGAMSNGITALAPRYDMGTLAIYKNGQVLLGAWGDEINISPELVAFRQNGPLVIDHGRINSRIYNNSPLDWGYTVNDVSPTIRSGIGLSADSKTLYYFCGPSLSMYTLARSMQAADANFAIQLDINNYWVLFVKIRADKSRLVAEPLLSRLMVANIDRYLWDYSRDYFYITAIEK
jgi:hypothetical protein